MRSPSEPASAEDGAAPLPPPDSDPSSEPQPNPQSGTLTAGAWDDNRNFTRFSQYRSDLLQNELGGALPTTDAEHAAAHEEFANGPTAHQMLDIALVIDTTGSMGDEITYLQTELVAISQEIATAYPEAQQRWALVAYKDVGDSYVVRKFDFIDNVTMFNQQLAMLSAAGGGDTPEAPDAALAEMVALDWRAEADVARLAFWVADAPHHDGNAATMAEAIRDSHELGVHVYPVASSGIGELTELTMRSSAQLTGGRYLFLTDDSGVGGAHKEPTIPCYFVTRLDRAITRMVDIEMSGEYREPAEADIVRTGGDPEDGACTLESGDEVVAF
ncbi:MAG TPA: vWA domain-containing protein [Polyangiales bacterium]|nr:vWA domain-containing protein [Polyangiales bacterium]